MAGISLKIHHLFGMMILLHYFLFRFNYLVSLTLKISPKTPLAVT